MRHFTFSFASLAAALLAATPALAQTTPEPMAPTAEPAPATPAPEPPPADVMPAPVTDAPVALEAAPAEAAPAAPAEETFPAAWFRMDYDTYGGGVSLWAGATHPLSDTIGLATDIYLDLLPGVAALGEFDIGPAFTAGPVIITPMVGMQFDFVAKKAVAIVPQLYVTGGPDPIYFELWFQNYNYAAFATNKANFGYFRFFIDFKLGKYLAIGPQAEATIAFNDGAKANGETLTSLPIGPSIMLSNYGKNNTLLLFGGYEAAKTGVDQKFVGRLTFIHNF